MPRPSETIDSVDTDAGKLELVRLAAGEWLITVDRRTLMSSRQHRSEVALAEMACRPLAERSAPRVLVAGLGMGYTLRAALDVLPADAEVVTAELNPTIARWNRGPIAALSGNALDDPRIQLEIIDVSVLIARAAEADVKDRYDAIVLDLYEGPYPVPHGAADTLFGRAALGQARAALRPEGCFAVWSEGPVEAFERRLKACGFRFERRRPTHKGPRHVVYLAWPGRSEKNRRPPFPVRNRKREQGHQ